MPRIKTNDPSRVHLHDYVVMDHRLKDQAAFDSYGEALAFCVSKGVGSWVVRILHPDGCGCHPLDQPGIRAGIVN